MPGIEFFGDEEKKHIQEVLDTGMLFRYNHDDQRNGIWKARDLEAAVCAFTGAGYAHAVSSGSAAVACVLAAAGIGYGDEVIVPPFTYAATIEAVLLAGALPVFAEIDETLCLSLAGLQAAATPKTKAVLLVHMCGQAAEMAGITTFCDERGIMLLEDAGQALGASFQGRMAGLFGRAGAYSFDFFKITTAGEGGVLVTNDKELYHLADSFSDHGHDHVGKDRGMEQHPIIGFNYRISELHAAVGLAQMERLEHVIACNRKHKAYLQDRLATIPEISFSPIPDPSGDSATFLNFFFPDLQTTQKVVAQFAQDGIGQCKYWFTNQYHFINQWEHITKLQTSATMVVERIGAPQDYANLQLPTSQDVVGRLLSLGIPAKSSEEALDALATKMMSSIQKCL